MDRWSRLSQQEKAGIMKLALGKGMYNLEDIRNFYNTYAEGGNLYPIGGNLLEGIKRGSKVDTDQCAEWSNGLLRNNGYLINGNAWNLGNVDTLFNGYEGLDRPEDFDRKAIEEYNHAASDSVYKNFDSNTLDKERPYAVNMFYNNSPALENAYNNGKGVTGTHTGLLTYDPDTKRWMVTHNIHGTIYQEPFVQLQSGKGPYGVTAVYSPRENTLWNKIKGRLGFAEGGNLYDGTTEPSQQMDRTYGGIEVDDRLREDLSNMPEEEYLKLEQAGYFGKPMTALGVDKNKSYADYTGLSNIPIDRTEEVRNDFNRNYYRKRAAASRGIIDLTDLGLSLANPFYGVTSGLVHAGLAGKDMYDNGINVGNATNLALGLAPVALHAPTVYKGFKKALKKEINYKNANKITDSQWDAAYNEAIKNKDTEELQRLRDLHFLAKTPDNKYPHTVYTTVRDEYDPNFNYFDPNIRGSYAVYTTPSKHMSSSYARKSDRTKELYIYSKNPVEFNGGKYWNDIAFMRDDVPSDVYDKIHATGNYGVTTRDIEKGLSNTDYDSFIVKDIIDYGGSSIKLPLIPSDVVATYKPSHLKLTDAITYDDFKKIIPLSKRDDFMNRDLRYSIAALVGAGVANKNK